MIGIIGGGVIGLFLAYYLSEQSYPVTIYESEYKLGGKCSWIELGGINVDKFYHAILCQDISLINLINDLGILQELRPSNTKTGFYCNGKSYPISTFSEFMGFPLLNLSDRFRLGLTFLSARWSNDWKKIDSFTARDWLLKNGSAKNYELIWSPLLKLRYGHDMENLSAVDIWSRLIRLGGSRSNNLKEKMYYLTGGIKKLIDTLENALIKNGVKIKKKSRVENIDVEKGRVKGISLLNGQYEKLENIVSTIPLLDFNRLLSVSKNEWPLYPFLSTCYLTNICLILKLNRPLNDFYVLNIGDSEFPFTGVIGLSNLYQQGELQGSHIFYLTRYFKKNVNSENINKQQLLYEYLPFLKKICPDFDLQWIDDFTLVEDETAGVFHTKNYHKLIPPYETPIQGLFLLCDAQIYPEITLIDTASRYARNFAEKYFLKINEKL